MLGTDDWDSDFSLALLEEESSGGALQALLLWLMSLRGVDDILILHLLLPFLPTEAAAFSV